MTAFKQFKLSVCDLLLHSGLVVHWRRVPLLVKPAVGAYNLAMVPVSAHRKRVTHFNEPGHYHELTFSCFRRLPLLIDDAYRVLLSHSIEQTIARTSLSARGLRVHAEPSIS